MSQIARVRQTREDIASRQPWIVLQNARFGLSGGEQLQAKFDGQPGASDNRFACENRGVDHNPIWPRHALMKSQLRHKLAG
jgi:hypothetical protein